MRGEVRLKKKLLKMRQIVFLVNELRPKKKFLTLRQIVFPEMYKLGMIFKPLHGVGRL
jgi:hypothetical protein